MRKTTLLLVALLCMSCTSNGQNKQKENQKMTTKAEIYLAGGCFWGTEHFLKQIDGVLNTEVGYANGNGKDPSYQQVCTDKTGFAEAVHVTYDPRKLPLSLLIQLYFQTIDPTRQRPRNAIPYRNLLYGPNRPPVDTGRNGKTGCIAPQKVSR